MFVVSAMEKLGIQLADIFAHYRDGLADVEFLKMKRFIMEKIGMSR